MRRCVPRARAPAPPTPRPSRTGRVRARRPPPQAAGQLCGAGNRAGIENVVVFVAHAPLYPFGQRGFVFRRGGVEQIPYGRNLFGAGDKNAEFGGYPVDKRAVAVFFPACGRQGVVEAVYLLQQGAGGGGSVGGQEGEVFRRFAVFPQPNGVVAAV